MERALHRRPSRIPWLALPMTVGIVAAACDPTLGPTRSVLAIAAVIDAVILQGIFWAMNTANYFEPLQGAAFRTWARWVFAWAAILAFGASQP